MPALNTVNFGLTALNGAIPAGATSCVFTVPPNNALTPFKATIDAEIFLVTAVNGSTYTVLGGQEGTTPTAHTNGTVVSIDFTSEMFQSCQPNGRSLTITGGTLQMLRTDKKLALSATNSGIILLPPDAYTWEDYTIDDIMNNFGTYNQTIKTADGITTVYTMGDNYSPGQGAGSLTLYQTDTGLWRIKA